MPSSQRSRSHVVRRVCSWTQRSENAILSFAHPITRVIASMIIRKRPEDGRSFNRWQLFRSATLIDEPDAVDVKETQEIDSIFDVRRSTDRRIVESAFIVSRSCELVGTWLANVILGTSLSSNDRKNFLNRLAAEYSRSIVVRGTLATTRARTKSKRSTANRRRTIHRRRVASLLPFA